MSKDYEVPSDKEFTYKKDYQEDWSIHKDYVQTFDAYEAMLISEVWDSVSNSIDGSKMTDGYSATLAKERAGRVMAKLPEGMTESAGKADVGKAAFMDILRQKWIYPNANAQHPFLEKLNMWQLYSSVYGYMPMMYDWNVSKTGYVGPDCWLWNPRNLVPQQGRVSIEDMDYVTALTWVSKKWLEDRLEDISEGDGWDKDALELLIEHADDTADADLHKDTLTDRTRVPQSHKKGVCLATRYEAGEDGRWCTFAPDHSYIQVRETPNPHKNGRIPFVIKYSQPLFDSFYGLGDFQRSRSLQFGRDGLRNFYFKGVKMNLIPPIVANSNGVLKHTLDYREGAVMLETLPNSIRRLETSTAGLATYQAAMSDLTGSLLSQYGTQNASLPGSEALNPSQGKTPAAIGMYSSKEASRDGDELRHLEASIEQLMDGMFSLVANIGTEDIPIALFAEDIKDIVDSGMGDLQELFTNFKLVAQGKAGELKINPSKLKGIEYRFNVTPDSTAKTNQQEQLANLERLIGTIGKFQNIFKDDPRVEVNWGAMMEAYEAVSGVKGAKNFVKYNPQAPAPHDVEMQMSQKPPPPKQLLSYKDAPEDIKRQMEKADGYQPSENPQTPDMVLKAHQIDKKAEVDQAKMMLDAHKHTVDSGISHMQAQNQHVQAQAQQANQAQQAERTAQITEKSAKMKPKGESNG
jgi:hypothetical protein